MAREHFLDLVLFVRREVGEDYVNGLVLWHIALDAIEETDELPMAMALHVLGDDRSVEHAGCGKQSFRAMALAIVGKPPGHNLAVRPVSYRNQIKGPVPPWPRATA